MNINEPPERRKKFAHLFASLRADGSVIHHDADQPGPAVSDVTTDMPLALSFDGPGHRIYAKPGIVGMEYDIPRRCG